MTDLTAGEQGLLEAARGGDATAFEQLVAPRRSELQAHCYRMLGSLHDAEDAVQEAMLRAWRGLPRFEGRSSLRSWLYRIATNACLTALDRRGSSSAVLPLDRGPAAEVGEHWGEAQGEVRWLGPYPDDDAAPGLAAPAARFERRESLELAFVAALQHLPPNQRAALLLREVLGFSAKEVAELLETTPQAVNSALQHARRNIDERLPEESQQATLRELGDDALQDLVARYTDALERADVDAIVALLAEDASWSMPPSPGWYVGHDAIRRFLLDGPSQVRWRHQAASANGQPAVGCYTWDAATGTYRPWVLDVLTLDRSGRITAVTAFIGPEHFAPFGLPAALPAA